MVKKDCLINKYGVFLCDEDSYKVNSAYNITKNSGNPNGWYKTLGICKWGK